MRAPLTPSQALTLCAAVVVAALAVWAAIYVEPGVGAALIGVLLVVTIAAAMVQRNLLRHLARKIRTLRHQSTAEVARYPALPRLFPQLRRDAAIFLEDADLPGEREAIRRWVDEGLATDVRHHGGLATLRVASDTV